MEIVKVQATKYKTKDGRLFDREKDAELHELFLDKKAKSCRDCGGTGKSDLAGDGRQFSICGACKGKGYLLKVEKWE